MDSLEVTQAILGQEKKGEFHIMRDGRITTESRESACDESVNLAFADAVNRFQCRDQLPKNSQMIPGFVGDLRRCFEESIQKKHRDRPALQDAFLPFEVDILSRLYRVAAQVSPATSRNI